MAKKTDPKSKADGVTKGPEKNTVAEDAAHTDSSASKASQKMKKDTTNGAKSKNISKNIY